MSDATRGRIVRSGAGTAVLIAAGLAMLIAASCSVVFRSSIQGTIVDKEDYDDGTTTGVSDATVYLYDDEASWEQDYDAYVEGDGTTLPDSSGRTEYLYFQSTATDTNGGYDFTGFIWENLASEYGKTADRKRIYLLIYHPNYGLSKSPVPLYVVSDVTNQLDLIKITDRWNQGTLSGRVLDWKNSGGLSGATVAFYVAKSWTYDGSGDYTNVEYPSTASATTTTDADGYWSAKLNFPMEPDRETHKGAAPVRVTFILDNYRANDPSDGTGLSNTGLVTNVDMDEDGRDAAHGDYTDAYLLVDVTLDTTTTVATVTMQRYHFSTTVNGRTTNGTNYINGVKVTLETPDGTIYTAYSETQTSGNIELDGVFDLGTVEWDIADASDQHTGEVPVTILTDGLAPASGDVSSITPDDAVVLELRP